MKTGKRQVEGKGKREREKRSGKDKGKGKRTKAFPRGARGVKKGPRCGAFRRASRRSRSAAEVAFEPKAIMTDEVVVICEVKQQKGKKERRHATKAFPRGEGAALVAADEGSYPRNCIFLIISRGSPSSVILAALG